jgi:hypothetical protein
MKDAGRKSADSPKKRQAAQRRKWRMAALKAAQTRKRNKIISKLDVIELLAGWVSTVMLDAMKTMSTREFFHAPAVVKSLRPGQSVLVTDNGKPNFTITKAGSRPVKTAEDLRREAEQIFPGKRPKVNFTSLIRNLKNESHPLAGGFLPERVSLTPRSFTARSCAKLCMTTMPRFGSRRTSSPKAARFMTSKMLAWLAMA